MSTNFIFLISTTFYFSIQENSSYQFIKEKTEKQIYEKEEGRYEAFIEMKNHLNRQPSKWIYGIGMFNYNILNNYETKLSQYHNSYLEVLFGGGIITFYVFVLFMIVRPLKVFLKKIGQHSLLFFPLAIIPFFESDLTAGQFLFFPWFTYMILLIAKELKS